MRLTETQRFVTGKAAPLGDFTRLLRRLHLDGPLLGGLLLICAFGLVVLYSAVGEDMRLWVNQVVRMLREFQGSEIELINQGIGSNVLTPDCPALGAGTGGRRSDRPPPRPGVPLLWAQRLPGGHAD